MFSKKRIAVFTVAVVMSLSTMAYAQTPPPVPVWTGNFGAGLALTNGNTDTKSVNLALGLVRDPKKLSVLRVNGLYLRGDSQGVVIVNQTQFLIRDEINISTR